MEDPASKSEEFLTEIAAAQSLEALEQIRIKLLGRNGAITALMRGLGELPVEQRREAGEDRPEGEISENSERAEVRK